MNAIVAGWNCRKQIAVEVPTMEAESAHAGQELFGVRELLTELYVKVVLPMTMEMDNQVAIGQLKINE